MEPQIILLIAEAAPPPPPLLKVVLLHLLPAFPLVSRRLVCLPYPAPLHERLSESEKDRETNRTIILALLGVSFTGLLALSVVDAKVQLQTSYPVYYMLVSFLSLIPALNLQSYKRVRWHNILGAALVETATLSIILTVAAIVLSSQRHLLFRVLICLLAFGTWAADHFIRLRMWRGFLQRRAAQLLSSPP